ncbi:hypothetical protein LOTGIDRAFT_162777 [Lottia gigantea]|uniref:Uncharacterized protein n=1 Tax=Lottia gigantea TaxID=225164 RepID=V4AFH4_LOTGI|nr:hypothetical protein LOTGIDRAFT_162777 [Lottia gigantea]ESO92126.1 hypothetical protein LOTGIDRAFT_162777 [Lottia gigantea]
MSGKHGNQIQARDDFYFSFLLLTLWRRQFHKCSDGVCVDSTSWICECFSPLKTTHSIECCGDNIIRLEGTGETILYEQINYTSCAPSKGDSSCLVKGENNFKVNYEDKLNIYNSCSGKKRCNVTVNPSRNMKIQIPVACKPAPTKYTLSETSSKILSIIYIAANDYIGKEITYSCAAKAAALFLEVFYIHLGPRSCKKVKMYSLGERTYGLGCTDSGMTMFYKDIGSIGTEFSLEIKDLKLEKNEVIYLKLASGSNINVGLHCHGSHKDVTETPNTPSTTENPKMVDKDEDETNPYIIFGGILAAVIVINIVCIGVYCYIRNRQRPKETTTNEAMANRKRHDSDNSHYNYIDYAEVNKSKYKCRQHPATHTADCPSMKSDFEYMKDATQNSNQISKTSRPLYFELAIVDQTSENDTSSYC